MVKTLLPALVCISTTGCVVTRPVEPVASDTPENNAQYRVDYLFEHDGCKVYRFYDRGNYVYFTNCSNQAVMVTDSTRTINSIHRHQ